MATEKQVKYIFGLAQKLEAKIARDAVEGLTDEAASTMIATMEQAVKSRPKQAEQTPVKQLNKIRMGLAQKLVIQKMSSEKHWPIKKENFIKSVNHLYEIMEASEEAFTSSFNKYDKYTIQYHKEQKEALEEFKSRGK